MEVVVLAIAVALVLFFTVRFVIAVVKGEPFFSKLWEWVKDVFDSIT